MTKNLTYIGIASLAVIAVVLGYTIFQQQKTPSPNYQPVSTNQQSITPQVPTDTTQNNLSSQTSGTEDIIKRFVNLPESGVEKTKFFADLNTSAQEGNQISIGSGCKTNPVILKIKKGASLKIQNDDKVDHTISIEGKESFVKSKNSVDLVANWAVGAQGLHCDPDIVGIIYIVE